MEVTAANFGKLKNQIIAQIKDAQYFAFDLEFTGLKFQNFSKDHISLLPYQKYNKLKYVAETYQVIQLGLSIVTFKNKLKVYPYNFYLFPRNPVASDKNISMQLKCVNFNSDNGIDWNKWIKEGINYIRLSEKESIERSQKKVTVRKILSEHEDESFVEIANQFLQIVGQVGRGKKQSPMTIQSSKFHQLGRYLLQLFNLYIQENNLNVTLEERKEVYILKKISKNEGKQNQQRERQKKFGFSLIFQHIWKSKKPIIGHNCFLDLLYLFNSFIQPLPENYFQFKDILTKSENTFFDTKYIALNHAKYCNGSTTLQDLVKRIQKQQPKLTELALDNEYSKYSLSNPNLHEAGYDSYITAWVYQQFNRIYSNPNQKTDLQECANKININSSFFSINLVELEDEVRKYYSQNLIVIDIETTKNEDFRVRQLQEINKIRQGLSKFAIYRDYQIYAQNHHIFIEIKNSRKDILKRLFSLKFRSIKTFPVYLREQAYRQQKRGASQQNREYNTDKEKKKKTNSTAPEKKKKITKIRRQNKKKSFVRNMTEE